MSKLYLYNAIEIINKSAKEGIISFAEGDEMQMMLMEFKRFTKYNYPNIVALRNEIAEHLKQRGIIASSENTMKEAAAGFFYLIIFFLAFQLDMDLH